MSMIENFFTGNHPLPTYKEYYDMLRKGLELTRYMSET